MLHSYLFNILFDFISLHYIWSIVRLDLVSFWLIDFNISIRVTQLTFECLSRWKRVKFYFYVCFGFYSFLFQFKLCYQECVNTCRNQPNHFLTNTHITAQTNQFYYVYRMYVVFLFISILFVSLYVTFKYTKRCYAWLTFVFYGNSTNKQTTTKRCSFSNENSILFLDKNTSVLKCFSFFTIKLKTMFIKNSKQTSKFFCYVELNGEFFENISYNFPSPPLHFLTNFCQLKIMKIFELLLVYMTTIYSISCVNSKRKTFYTNMYLLLPTILTKLIILLGFIWQPSNLIALHHSIIYRRREKGR